MTKTNETAGEGTLKAADALRAEREQLLADNRSAPGWGAAVAYRAERIAEIDHELAALTAGAPAPAGLDDLKDVLREARKWVEQNTANVRGLSVEAAAPGEAMLQRIDRALARTVLPSDTAGERERIKNILVSFVQNTEVTKSRYNGIDFDAIDWRRRHEVIDAILATTSRPAAAPVEGAEDGAEDADRRELMAQRQNWERINDAAYAESIAEDGPAPSAPAPVEVTETETDGHAIEGAVDGWRDQHKALAASPRPADAPPANHLATDGLREVVDETIRRVDKSPEQAFLRRTLARRRAEDVTIATSPRPAATNGLREATFCRQGEEYVTMVPDALATPSRPVAADGLREALLKVWNLTWTGGRSVDLPGNVISNIFDIVNTALARTAPPPDTAGERERTIDAVRTALIYVGLSSEATEADVSYIAEAAILAARPTPEQAACALPGGAAVGKLRDHDPKALRGFAHVAWREGDKDTHRVLTAAASRIEALEAVVQPPRKHQSYWTGACFGMSGASFNLSFPAGTGEFVFREDEIEQIEEEGRTLWVSKIDASELIKLRQWLNDYLPAAPSSAASADREGEAS